MKYLFSELGKKVLESLSFTQTLYAFDYDGTLAPIVDDPEAAKATKETERLLNQLSMVASVVVISGRSVADLRRRTALHVNRLIGNHGLEGLGVHRESITNSESTCYKWVQALKRSWGTLKKDPGVFIEDKTYSLALHYRRSRQKQVVRRVLFAKINKLEPQPRVILGKSVINLIPKEGPHKGMALLEAMSKLNLRCAFYIGDDDTDEDVFSLGGSQQIISARVGQKKASQAKFYIKRQSEMNRLLRRLIELNEFRGET
ncbi:MAG: trehalose-phosphatase [Bdellovibrionales bacterium]|nr:trehalose-phosphatase [Bdellovibrionales bacterium]